MICQEAQELISGLVDDELTVEERRGIDVHLKECQNCQLTYRNEIALKQHLRAAGASLEVPADLREKILAVGGPMSPGLTDEAGRGETMGWLSFAGFRPAVAWAALVVLMVPLFYFWWPGESISLTALETHQKVLAGKMNFLRAENVAEVEKQMVRAVEARFAPMGYDLSMMRLYPVAGLVQKIGNRKVLVVSYQGEGLAITCFTFLGTHKDAPDNAALVFDAGKNMDFYTFSHEGTNAVLHREGEVICILVSQMPILDLLEIARAKARHA
jgi:hypothetical protein